MQVTLKEGKNRQIRRMVEAVGHEVKRLKRVRIENVKLADLADGEYVRLSNSERTELLVRVGLAD